MPRCKNCNEKFEPKYFLQKNCEEEECRNAEIKMQLAKKQIPKASKKRQPINEEYKIIRIEVLAESKFKCFIEGCKNVATTIEHTAGRIGFYDHWAKDNNIPLVIDKRFLKACCFIHNGELENNPELSKKYQLSKIHGGKKL